MKRGGGGVFTAPPPGDRGRAGPGELEVTVTVAVSSCELSTTAIKETPTGKPIETKESRKEVHSGSSRPLVESREAKGGVKESGRVAEVETRHARASLYSIDSTAASSP